MALVGEDAPGKVIIDVAKGTQVGSVTLSGFQYAHDIDWHLRLDRLAILERKVGERWAIWIGTPDGREVRPVYTDEQVINSICWSPLENVGALREITERGGRVTGTESRRHVVADRTSADVRFARRGQLDNLERWTLSSLRPAQRQHESGASRSHTSRQLTPTHYTWHAQIQLAKSFARWTVDSCRGCAPPRTPLVKLSASGGEPVPLTSGNNHDGAPASSPDGRTIAFASTQAGNTGVWLMRPNGTQLDGLRNSRPSVNLLTSWTPDGRVMWQETTTGDQMNYRIRDLSTGGDSMLLPGNGHGWVFLPEFSPSGKEVAVFWNRVNGPRGLYVLSWPTLDARLLVQASYWPAGWVADGSSIVATGEGGVWLVSARDGRSTRLAACPCHRRGGGCDTRWQVTGGECCRRLSRCVVD